MRWKIYDSGSFDLYWGNACVKGAFPMFDCDSIRPNSVSVDRGDGESDGKVEYFMGNNQSVVVRFGKVEGKNDEIKLDCSLVGFEETPHWFKPLGAGRICEVERMFKQGFGFGGPSGIIELNEKNIKNTYESYLSTGLFDECDNTLVFGTMENRSILNRATVYARWDRWGLNDQTADGYEYFLDVGFMTERINAKVNANGNEWKMPTIIFKEGLACDGKEAYDTFREYAQELAEFNGVKELKPPRYHYCSWYCRGPYFSIDDLRELLDGLDKIEPKIPLQAIQIDHGYCSYTGDWLDVGTYFPDGMEHAFSLIRERGYAAGVWVAPFMVGSRSRVATEHPDWLLRYHDGSLVVEMETVDAGEKHHAFADEYYYVLDSSHPDAFEYIRNVFRTMRKWGATLYKTDFMDWGYRDSTKYKRYTPGKTAAQYFVDVLSAIREEIGEESYWLACISPFAPFIGFADGMRIGNDIVCNWRDGAVEDLLRETVADQYFNNILWQNDPDVTYIRDILTNFTAVESRSIALWNAMSGGSVNTSDPLHKISKEALDLWRFLEPGEKHFTARYPGWSKPGVRNLAVRFDEEQNCWWVYVINTHNHKSGFVYNVNELIGEGLAKIVKCGCCMGVREDVEMGVVDRLCDELEAHAGGLYKLYKSV